MPTFVAGSGTGDGYGNILLPIVDVTWFKSALFGALFELTNPANWIEMGDVGVSFAVEEAVKMIEGYTFMNFNPLPVGVVHYYCKGTPAPGYLECTGAEYNLADYPELFAVIGYQFGGSGDVFNVPYLQDLVVVGANDSYAFGSEGGEAGVNLEINQIPPHHHTIPLTATTLAVEPGEVTVLTPVPFFTQDTGDTGGNDFHENMQPYMALTCMIYAGRV